MPSPKLKLSFLRPHYEAGTFDLGVGKTQCYTSVSVTEGLQGYYQSPKAVLASPAHPGTTLYLGFGYWYQHLLYFYDWPGILQTAAHLTLQCYEESVITLGCS